MNPKATISPNDLQTGDLLFFHGVGTAFDNAIETVTRSPYPHVAMIVRNPPWMEEEGIYVIQSLFQCPNYDAVEQHEHKTGVQLNRLNDVRGERIDVRVPDHAPATTTFARRWQMPMPKCTMSATTTIL